MHHFANIVRRICLPGTGVGAVFLAGVMVLIVANIIVRLFGSVIAGTYELIELLIIVTVAFALGYTALMKGHVVVDLLVARFPRRMRAIVAIFTCLLSLGTWGLITWANTDMLLDRWTREQSILLEIPYLPFRIILVFGLFLFCMLFLIEMLRALKQAVSE